MSQATLQELIQDARDPDPHVRSDAIFELAEFIPGSRLAETTLILGLKDPECEVRAAALETLGDIEPPLLKAVPQVIAALRDQDFVAKVWAAYTLGCMKPDDPAAIQALIAAASDPEVAYDAMAAIGKFGDSAKVAVPLLIEAIKNQFCVTAAAEALGGIGPAAKKAIPELRRLLSSRDVLERIAAAEALGGMGPVARRAIPTLLDALSDAAFFTEWQAEAEECDRKLSAERRGMCPWYPGYLRIAIAVALWQIARHKSAIAAIVEALHDKSYGVRWQAVLAMRIVRLPEKIAVQELTVLANDPKDVVRAYALEHLAAIMPIAPVKISVLLRALDDPSPKVRSRVAWALGSLGPLGIAALTSLTKLMATDRGNVRIAAASAVWHIGHEQIGIDTLIAMLDDEDPDVRLAVLTELGNIGAAAERAVPAIKSLCEASEGLLHRRCREVVRQISGDWHLN